MAESTKITGYSERGAISSLFYEIALSTSSLDTLGQLVSAMHFPRNAPIDDKLTGAEILIEPSLSDFGDPDVILLLTEGEEKSIVFVEAKVQAQTAWSGIDCEWCKFKKHGEGEKTLSSSNLFTQIYHKARLIDAVKAMGLEHVKTFGVDFPPCSTKTPRKIGENPVVFDVVKKIQDYMSNVWFAVIVPDNEDNAGTFFEDWWKNKDWPFADGQWGSPDFFAQTGYVTWNNISGFCDKNDLVNTSHTLNFNGSQIFKTMGDTSCI